MPKPVIIAVAAVLIMGYIVLIAPVIKRRRLRKKKQNSIRESAPNGTRPAVGRELLELVCCAGGCFFGRLC